MAPISGFHSQNLGYVMVGWTGDIVLVYFVVDTVLLRDERNRWKVVKDKVRKLVDSELTGIVADVSLVTAASHEVVTLPVDSTGEEEVTALRHGQLEKMTQLSRDIGTLRQSVDTHLFQGGYGSLFAHRAQNLDDLQLKYWAKFLEPEQMALIIDLQRLLESLDSDVRIVLKYEAAPNTSNLSKAMAKVYENYGYGTLKELMSLLVENVEQGMIPIP